MTPIYIYSLFLYYTNQRFQNVVSIFIDYALFLTNTIRIMKKNLLLAAISINCFVISLNAQGTCNPAGNLIIYSNYDGGDFTINIDENIPDIRIGLCSYEDLHVTITGAYAANVTQVLYAGYNDDLTTSVTGVDAGLVDVLVYPPVTLYDPDGNANMVCAYECDTNYIPGGCNTVDQATDYFITELGGSIRYGYFQYGIFSGSYDMSDGGNCCVDAACSILVDAGQDQTICIGDSVQLSGDGASTYSWFPIDFLDDPYTDDPYSFPTTNTTYFLTGTDADGCTGIDTVNVFVSPLPITDITASGATLTASGGTGYQWLLNGEIIPGATSSTYTATETGTYSVIVYSADGCEAISDQLDIFLDGIEETYISDQIKLFPNPAGEFISMDIRVLTGDTQVYILNSIGQNIYSINTSVNYILEIPLQTLASGIYHVHIINEEHVVRKSFVIK